MMPCPSCHTITKPYDTEPSHGHLTYAYECQCGNVWTEDMDHLLTSKYCETHRAWAVLHDPGMWCHTVQQQWVFCEFEVTVKAVQPA